jgi:hypothetical protein
MGIEFIKIDRKIKTQLDEFLMLPLKIYGDNPVSRNTIMKTRGLLEAPHDVSLYVVRNGGSQIVGRMSVYVNRAICDPDGIPYGQVGLFEVIENYGIFCAMLDHARKILSECRSMLFPFFISTWYQYRFISKKEFYFFFEYPNMPYYPEFAKRYGVSGTTSYISMLCPYMDKFIEDNMMSYRKIEKDGFYFRNIDMKRFDRELETFYEMSTAGFTDNLFYADIPFEEFRGLYMKSKGMIISDFFKIVMFEGREAGFFYSSPDYTRYFEALDLNSLVNRARLYLGRKGCKGIVLKSTAVLPEYRSKGVQSAMSCAEAIEARARGYEYLIGAFCHVESFSVRPMKAFSRDNIYELYTMRI